MLMSRIGPSLDLDSYYSVIGAPLSFIGVITVASNYLIPALLVFENEKIFQIKNHAGNLLIAFILASLISLVIFTIYFCLTNQFYSNTIGSTSSFYSAIILSCLAAFFSMLTTIFSAIGIACGKVIGSVLITPLPQLATLLYLIINADPQIFSMLVVLAVSFLLQATIVGCFFWNYWTISTVSIKRVSQILLLVLPTSLGALCFSSYSAIDAVLSPSLGVGVMSYQAFSQRIVIAIGSVLSIGPFLLSPNLISSLLINEDYFILWLHLKKIFLYLISSCCLGALLIFSIGPFIFGRLFQHGNFASSDVRAVVEITSILLIGAGSMLSVAIVFRVLFALHKFKIIVILGLGWTLMYGLIGFFLSYSANRNILAISYTITWTLFFIVAVIYMWKLLELLDLNTPDSY